MIGSFLECILRNFEKISVKELWGDHPLYLKIYTDKSAEEVMTVIHREFGANNIVLNFTKREPVLINGDCEKGIEILVDFKFK